MIAALVFAPWYALAPVGDMPRVERLRAAEIRLVPDGVTLTDTWVLRSAAVKMSRTTRTRWGADRGPIVTVTLCEPYAAWVAADSKRGQRLDCTGTAAVTYLNEKAGTAWVVVGMKWLDVPTLLHELGHVWGLEHSRDRRSYMFPAAGVGFEWTAEDLEAMRR